METITAKELFQKFAPSFNFEYGPDELLKLALERGFVSPIEGDDENYLINEEY